VDNNFSGEANRFVASLVKNSRSSDAMNCIVSSGALKHLVAMSGAEHVLMQNEAIIALTIIVSSLAGKILPSDFVILSGFVDLTNTVGR
jgi:hypothetical protein